MKILVFIIPLAIALGLFFLFAFIWATRSGQYEDMDTPAQRILLDDDDTHFQLTKGKQNE